MKIHTKNHHFFSFFAWVLSSVVLLSCKSNVQMPCYPADDIISGGINVYEGQALNDLEIIQGKIKPYLQATLESDSVLLLKFPSGICLPFSDVKYATVPEDWIVFSGFLNEASAPDIPYGIVVINLRDSSAYFDYADSIHRLEILEMSGKLMLLTRSGTIAPHGDFGYSLWYRDDLIRLDQMVQKDNGISAPSLGITIKLVDNWYSKTKCKGIDEVCTALTITPDSIFIRANMVDDCIAKEANALVKIKKAGFDLSRPLPNWKSADLIRFDTRTFSKKLY